jgi:hypothetical protein
LTSSVSRAKQAFLTGKPTKFGLNKPLTVFVANEFNMFCCLQAIFSGYKKTF